jgi:hypothetical protein
MSKALTELIRDANRNITPADRHAILDLIEQQAARIAALEAQIATVAPAVDALTDDRIIDIAYECNAAPSVPESTLIDFARRIRYE